MKLDSPFTTALSKAEKTAKASGKPVKLSVGNRMFLHVSPQRQRKLALGLPAPRQGRLSCVRQVPG
jgi:hypothetical protein